MRGLPLSETRVSSDERLPPPPSSPSPPWALFNSPKYFFILGLGLDPSWEARGAETASHPTLGPPGCLRGESQDQMGDWRAAPHSQHPFYVEKGVKPSGQLSKVVRPQPEFLQSGEGQPFFRDSWPSCALAPSLSL